MSETPASAFTATPYYTLEPHQQWVTEENQHIAIEPIIERVYGKPYSSLRGCQRDNDNLPNDSIALYKLTDDDDYEQALADFDEPAIYLGWNHQTKESVTKEGMTQLDYWLSIKIDATPGAATVEANPPEHTDLEGAVFDNIFYANRCFSPSLQLMLADLIRRGELPRGNYIFRHWW